MNLLLDTVTFLWWVTDSPDLSARATDLIGDSSRRVFLSPVSVWEIVVKHTLGRLPLPEDPASFIPRLRADSGFEELPLGEEAVLQLLRLPALHLHRGGRDRLRGDQFFLENKFYSVREWLKPARWTSPVWSDTHLDAR